MSTKALMVSGLQNILKHERKHFEFYLQASFMVKGYDRLLLKPLLEKETASELEHVKLFADKIVALGDVPTQEIVGTSYNFSLSTTGAQILDWAMYLEREILQVYHDFYPEAEKYAEKFGDMSIALLLEENIEHTTADVEEMEKIRHGY